MDYTDKTREELIKELQDLQQEFDSMKELFEKDITERKQTDAQGKAALEALRRAEDNFRRTLDDSPFGVRIVTAEGETIYTNRAILDIYGYDSIEEIRTTPIKNRYTPESYAEFQIRYDKRRQGEESPSEYEISIVKKNGEVRRLQVFRKEVLWNDERQYQVLYRDITERKRAEEEIKLKNELLQAIIAEKDKFFSILAHDLRGPLSTFVAATQILTEEIQTMDMEEIKEITLSMNTSATNIYNLLENLLEWSQLKQGGMVFVPGKLNLKKKIEACIDVLYESARGKGIEIAISIPDEMEVFADNHMFDIVIRNLVSNAIKFTPVGGKVSVAADYNSDHSIEVKVSDSGIGMTPELKNKLFLLNENTSRKGTEGEPGTGLGLLLVKGFIEKHGGKIWVDSEVGKGSTFSFTIGQFGNLEILK
ncbi:MAG: PAS domain-containing sensor histidine kinase [Bacteroidales bacterium]